mmetsp:Transcript_68487/g.142790  ORF Transcript_68487/g.142790 Transcript_68487/m.142790 type:complete len:85 (-) Transcript_68487:146-400(-)
MASEESAGCASCFGMFGKKKPATSNPAPAAGAGPAQPGKKAEKPRRLSQVEKQEQDLLALYQDGLKSGTLTDARAASAARDAAD